MTVNINQLVSKMTLEEKAASVRGVLLDHKAVGEAGYSVNVCK